MKVCCVTVKEGDFHLHFISYVWNGEQVGYVVLLVSAINLTAFRIKERFKELLSSYIVVFNLIKQIYKGHVLIFLTDFEIVFHVS